MHKNCRSADLIWYLSGFIYKPSVQLHASAVITEVYLSVSVHKIRFFFYYSPVVARTSCEGSEDPGRGGHVSDREESPGVNVP